MQKLGYKKKALWAPVLESGIYRSDSLFKKNELNRCCIF